MFLTPNEIEKEVQEVKVLIPATTDAQVDYFKLGIQRAELIINKRKINDKEDPKIKLISNVVCNYFNVTEKEMLQKNRKKEILHIRQVFHYLTRKFESNISLGRIGAYGTKDVYSYCSVRHSCERIEGFLNRVKNG